MLALTLLRRSHLRARQSRLAVGTVGLLPHGERQLGYEGPFQVFRLPDELSEAYNLKCVPLS